MISASNEAGRILAVRAMLALSFASARVYVAVALNPPAHSGAALLIMTSAESAQSETTTSTIAVDACLEVHHMV
jgi:hypothetical protein